MDTFIKESISISNLEFLDFILFLYVSETKLYLVIRILLVGFVDDVCGL